MLRFLIFVLFAVQVTAQQHSEGNGSAPLLRSGIPSTKFNKNSCKSGASHLTFPSGWKTKICHATACVSADPGYLIDSTTLVVQSHDCRGRRTCCGQGYTVNVRTTNIGGVDLPVPVEVPGKACVDIQAEGETEEGVTGRGECSITATQRVAR